VRPALSAHLVQTITTFIDDGGPKNGVHQVTQVLALAIGFARLGVTWLNIVANRGIFRGTSSSSSEHQTVQSHAAAPSATSASLGAL